MNNNFYGQRIRFVAESNLRLCFSNSTTHIWIIRLIYQRCRAKSKDKHRIPLTIVYSWFRIWTMGALLDYCYFSIKCSCGYRYLILMITVQVNFINRNVIITIISTFIVIVLVYELVCCKLLVITFCVYGCI